MLETERSEYASTLEKLKAEGRESEVKGRAQVSAYREKNHKLSKQNRLFRQALQEMNAFFEQTLHKQQ